MFEIPICVCMALDTKRHHVLDRRGWGSELGARVRRRAQASNSYWFMNCLRFCIVQTRYPEHKHHLERFK